MWPKQFEQAHSSGVILISLCGKIDFLSLFNGKRPFATLKFSISINNFFDFSDAGERLGILIHEIPRYPNA